MENIHALDTCISLSMTDKGYVQQIAQQLGRTITLHSKAGYVDHFYWNQFIISFTEHLITNWQLTCKSEGNILLSNIYSELDTKILNSNDIFLLEKCKIYKPQTMFYKTK